ncbi:trigger factor [Faecalitalea cylindroides]|uniref:trigger factor n=1 Tax=Faecalitalea cylindroides TaxID=39483 RepID=UPI0022E75707|nr:trigger factor [Faecalitalea cylindroides]
MTSNWTLNEKSTGVLEVTVEGDAWKKAQNKALKKIKSRINIKGFRPGQVPEALIKKQISKEALYAEAAEEIANEALVHGIDENKLELVARPTLDIKEANDDKVVMAFNCVVSPEVTLGDYKGLDIHKEEVEVTEEDINAEVERIQNRYADWVIREEDEEAQLKDQVTIDFVGEKDGVAFEGGSGQNYPLELGSGTFIPGFEEQLVGVKTGDQKDVVVTFPEDYQAKDLAGQEATFKVTVHDIKYKELPEANDELVQKLKMDGVETLEQFKEKKADDLKAQKEKSAEDAFVNALIEKACENATVEIPEVMIESQIDREYKNFENRMMQSGFTAKQYLEAVGQTEAQLRETMRPSAEQNVKASLVLDAIVKAENIVIDDEAVENEFKQMSETYGMDVEKIKGIINPENVKYDLAQQKALELIKESVK